MTPILIVAAFAALLCLAGCGHAPGDLVPQPSPEQLATPKSRQAATAVDLQAAKRCEQLAREVPKPSVQTGAGSNAKVTYREFDAALDKANGRIGATRECIADLRTGFAKGLR